MATAPELLRVRERAPWRDRAALILSALGLAGPTVLAFFSGGYFDEARAWAGLVAWLFVLAAAIVRPAALGRIAWLSLGALGLLAAWTLLSMTWAPVAGSAYHAGQIDLVYLGALLAASLFLAGPTAFRAVEPVLVAGALVVIGYGLSERFLPGLIRLSSSLSAEGRLDQPLSYWNGMGELAAIALVLATRVSGDATRRAAWRVAGTAAVAPLGLGLFLSFSRGALFAAIAGVLTLIVLAPTREQLHAAAAAVAVAALAALSAAPFRGLTALAGSRGTRELQGVIALGLLVLVTAAAAGFARWQIRRQRPGLVRLPAHAPAIVFGLICAGLALAVALGAKETSKLPTGASAARYTTFRSDRYEYWRVALDAFASQPVHGVGAGGWAVWWLQKRHVAGFARDAHSLELQTLAELGLVGLGLLLAWFATLWLAARRALKRAARLAAGPIAGLTVYLVHSPLDWDWQLPALTLMAIVLAGALLAIAGPHLDSAREPAAP